MSWNFFQTKKVKLVDYYRFVDDSFEKSLSAILANLILPSFIFCEVILFLNTEDYFLIIQIILGGLTVYLIGVMVGLITGKILKSGNNELKFLCAVISSPNATSMQLIFLEVLSPTLTRLKYINNSSLSEELNSISQTTSVKGRGMVYISLLSIFANIWRWTVAFNLIQKEESQSETLKIKSIKQICSELLNTPIIVSFITIIICYVPTLRYFFITDKFFLKETILNIHLTISKSYNFLVIFLLGLNLSNIETTDAQKSYSGLNQINSHMDNLIMEDQSLDLNDVVDMKKIFIIAGMKLILNPILGSPVIYGFYKIGFITDGVLVFQLFLTLACPIAINILVICNVKNVKPKFMSRLMLFVYGASIFTITINNSVFLYYLLNEDYS